LDKAAIAAQHLQCRGEDAPALRAQQLTYPAYCEKEEQGAQTERFKVLADFGNVNGLKNKKEQKYGKK
jgi:hypothetical protein